ncbi:DUF3828 domain-containing protein [Haliscomenobacter hydrossis]|uniref:DUF3828 domain-containing protein n=1 Tax=Haliscomenobacter hydrossis (strain ATCC 27775 / DSM 1100 / LMG 10767 / O) TaxID=760192 RepID=F4L2P8_HALH1|nr:DUF3828 domain-containing protein [Haliscomenobacter hydrossis]AEE48612.1 hypothetical protein Halhy_0704 [Haliscomenobacter hydrossis DSM 1100]
MKYLLLLCLAMFSLSACQNTANKTDQSTEEPTDSGDSQDDPDLVAITDVIHGFYQWYDDSMEKIQHLDYVKTGKHLSLDNKKVDAYFDQFLKSGFISKEYVDGEKAYLKALEVDWKKTEYEDGPIDGLDYDRFFCAQDWDIKAWTESFVGVEGLGTDQATATMSSKEGGGPNEQKIELKKENGKWLISKIICGE